MIYFFFASKNNDVRWRASQEKNTEWLCGILLAN